MCPRKVGEMLDFNYIFCWRFNIFYYFCEILILRGVPVKMPISQYDKPDFIISGNVAE